MALVAGYFLGAVKSCPNSLSLLLLSPLSPCYLSMMPSAEDMFQLGGKYGIIGLCRPLRGTDPFRMTY